MPETRVACITSGDADLRLGEFPFHHPLPLLHVPDVSLVPVDLVLKDGFLYRRALLVELQARDAVQSVQVHPAAERHADPVHYEV